MAEKSALRTWANIILILILILDGLLILFWVLSKMDLSPIPVYASPLDLMAFLMVFVAVSLSLAENNGKRK